MNECCVMDGAMSLQEHDLRYHEGNYRGGKCMYREAMKAGDKSDSELAEVNQREAALYFAWKQEMSTIEEHLKKNFPMLTAKNGARVHITEPDKEGVSKMMVWCKPEVPDSAIDEKALFAKMNELGFKASDFAVMTQAPNANRSQGSVKGKKLFVADIKKKVQPKFAEKKNDTAEVTAVEKSEMTDDKVSELLKRYGKKQEAGKIQTMTEEDRARERAKKYLGISNDWQ